jgi:uncharacterized protein with NRDE domain
MCTLVIAAGVVSEHPLVVVANRDEELDRPSTPPFVWTSGETRFLAPRDDRAGGTWLGLNEHGVFVGITNRFLGPRDPARASRGELVVRALAHPTASAIHRSLADLDPRRYNGFHLVYADANDACATIADGESLAQVVLGRGLHVITERTFGAATDKPRRQRIESAWGHLAAPPFDPTRLTRLLAEHDPSDPFASTCIHLPELRYGTRSGMVLEVSTTPRMLWAEGPPCTARFEDVETRGVHGTGKTR